MDHLLFTGWESLLHVIIVGVASYTFLVLLLRMSGKRTLSRMNAYDMVVTMALGSILTKAMLTADQGLAESLLAIFLLIAFQFGLSWASCRWLWVRKLVTPSPAVLFHDGGFNRDVMRRERVGEEEVMAAVRGKGLRDLSEVDAVILGSNGEISVLVRPTAYAPPAVLRTSGQRV